VRLPLPPHRISIRIRLSHVENCAVFLNLLPISFSPGPRPIRLLWLRALKSPSPPCFDFVERSGPSFFFFSTVFLSCSTVAPLHFFLSQNGAFTLSGQVKHGPLFFLSQTPCFRLGTCISSFRFVSSRFFSLFVPR